MANDQRQGQAMPKESLPRRPSPVRMTGVTCSYQMLVLVVVAHLWVCRKWPPYVPRYVFICRVYVSFTSIGRAHRLPNENIPVTAEKDQGTRGRGHISRNSVAQNPKYTSQQAKLSNPRVTHHILA